MARFQPRCTGTAGMTAPIRTAIIYGSSRDGRFCDKVVDWTVAHMAKHPEFELQRIDPAGLAAQLDQAETKTCMSGADAFIIVHPEYNHGYPASLKKLIDAYVSEWQAKPVAFVSY